MPGTPASDAALSARGSTRLPPDYEPFTLQRFCAETYQEAFIPVSRAIRKSQKNHFSFRVADDTGTG
jgi:hypothetical protein